jgi:hypothetical protein
MQKPSAFAEGFRDPVRISCADPLALALPEAARPAIAVRVFFVCSRLRASSRAAKQKSRPGYRQGGFVTPSGFKPETF